MASFCSLSNAQSTDTTINLIDGNWNNVVTGSHPNNCCTGGPAPLYEPSTNTIHFSYGLTAVHQVRAINQALSGSGIQINGWNWGYDLRNMNGSGGQSGTDTISVTSFITNSSGQIVQQSDQYYSTQFDWTRFTGTETLSSQISLTSGVNLGIQFVSRDAGYWAGYYGPQVRNVTLSANYTVDQCTADPLSSRDCPGYEQAYFNLQCTADPLYSTACPGYFSAWLNQVCSASPLADLLCPGYAEAYFAQQCTANPLYDPNCSGYGAAMAAQIAEQQKQEETKTTPVVVAQDPVATSVEDSTKEPTRTDVGGIETTTTGELVVPDGIPQIVKESAVKESPTEKEKRAGAPTSLVMSLLRAERERERKLVQETVSKAQEDSKSENANPSDGIGLADLGGGVNPISSGVGLQANFSGGVGGERNSMESQSQQSTKLNNNAILDSTTQRQQNISNESNKQPQGLRRRGEPNDMDSNTTIAALVQSPIGFESYMRGTLADGQMYAPKEIYKNQRVVDNRRVERIMNLQSDIRYEDMVNQQYNLDK